MSSDDVIINNNQLGTKYGKHGVGDYGLSGRNGISDYLGIIMETITDPSEVRYGDWLYQGDCEFYVSNNNLTIIRLMVNGSQHSRSLNQYHRLH